MSNSKTMSKQTTLLQWTWNSILVTSTSIVIIIISQSSLSRLTQADKALYLRKPRVFFTNSSGLFIRSFLLEQQLNDHIPTTNSHCLYEPQSGTLFETSFGTWVFGLEQWPQIWHLYVLIWRSRARTSDSSARARNSSSLSSASSSTVPSAGCGVSSVVCCWAVLFPGE